MTWSTTPTLHLFSFGQESDVTFRSSTRNFYMLTLTLLPIMVFLDWIDPSKYLEVNHWSNSGPKVRHECGGPWTEKTSRVNHILGT